MSLQFDTNNNYLRITDDSALTLPVTGWSIGGWFKMNSNISNYPKYIYSSYAGVPAFSFVVNSSIYISPNEAQVAFTDSSGNSVTLCGGPIADSDWHNIVVTRVGDVFSIYIDETLINSVTNAAVGEIDVPDFAYFAEKENHSVAYNFDGELAEWAKWNTGLSFRQVRRLYKGIKPTEIGTYPAWYMSMLINADELIAGLNVQDVGSVISEHPASIVQSTKSFRMEHVTDPPEPDPDPGLMYGTLIDANIYFSTRIHVDAWNDATDTEKTTALKESRQRIDLLKYRGYPVTTEVFPRYYGDESDGTETVPDNIKIACYECAYALLDGVNPEFEQENLAVSYETIAGTSTSYARGIVIPEHFASGIPSAYAWRFLRYYLATPGKVSIYKI